MKTPQQIKEEVEKGCGIYDMINPEFERSCGDILFNNTIFYCPICKAKLSILVEYDKAIKEIIESLDFSNIIRQSKVKGACVIEEEIKQEILSKIEEEK